MKLHDSGGLSFYSFSLFDPWPELVNAAFTRSGGVSDPPFDTLNVGYSVRDDQGSVAANRDLVARAVDWDPARVVSPLQVHGRRVAVVGPEQCGGPELPDTDVLVTDRREVLLMLKFADCVPITLWDPVRRVVALAHAGWKGTVLGTPAAALDCMAERHGCSPADIMVGIGPSIGPCCYEVGPDVAGAAARQFEEGVVLVRDGGRSVRFDLWAANAETLVRAGVARENIAVSGICTRCRNDLFYSHRASGGRTGRFAVVVGIRDGR